MIKIKEIIKEKIKIFQKIILIKILLKKRIKGQIIKIIFI